MDWTGLSVYLVDLLTSNNYCRIVLLQIVVFLKKLTARWGVEKNIKIVMVLKKLLCIHLTFFCIMLS